MARLAVRAATGALISAAVTHLAASTMHAWYHTTGRHPCGVWCPLAGHPYIPSGHRPRRTV